MERIDHILRGYLRELGIEKTIKQYEVLSLWPRIVGEKISAIAEPLQISKGKLVVHVKNASWRNELIFWKPTLIQKLNQFVGDQVIKDIIFK